uniref:Uncharacterized protein n=1 Tax=Vitis vinifera TaxID=29760 RepID=A5BP36_VITVI|nr:hypothetical protein VITISV_013477 [Vitis vinifera]
MEVHRAYRATPNKTSWFRISEKLAYLSKCREKPRFTFNSSSSSQRESQENRGADSTAANVLRRARPLRNQNLESTADICPGESVSRVNARTGWLESDVGGCTPCGFYD